MLVRGLFIPGEETVVDMTVFSERTEKRVAASMDPSRVFINPRFSWRKTRLVFNISGCMPRLM